MLTLKNSALFCRDDETLTVALARESPNLVSKIRACPLGRTTCPCQYLPSRTQLTRKFIVRASRIPQDTSYSMAKRCGELSRDFGARQFMIRVTVRVKFRSHCFVPGSGLEIQQDQYPESEPVSGMVRY
jgi:hypothetical protein